MLKGCGPACFLQPYAKPHPKYPVCEKAMGGKVCKRSCQGVLAAYRRSRQNNRAPSVAKKALALAKKMHCGWYVKYHIKAGKKGKKSRTKKRKTKKSQRKKKVTKKSKKRKTKKSKKRKTKKSKKKKVTKKSKKSQRKNKKMSKIQLYKLAKRLKKKHGDGTPLSGKTRRSLIIYIKKRT